jgi:hypothetical protein
LCRIEQKVRVTPKLEMSADKSLIVKCSHCKDLLSGSKFNEHKCKLELIGTKVIPVVNFIDTSYNGQRVMTGWGVDGVLYTFEVVSRKPIPYILSTSDDSYHDENPDDKLPVRVFVRGKIHSACYRLALRTATVGDWRSRTPFDAHSCLLFLPFFARRRSNR